MKVLHLEVLLMPNGEIICGEKSLGFLGKGYDNHLLPYIRECEGVIQVAYEDEDTRNIE